MGDEKRARASAPSSASSTSSAHLLTHTPGLGHGHGHGHGHGASTVTRVPWTHDRDHPAWLNVPLDAIHERATDADGTTHEKLVVFCDQGTDLWRNTSYGYVADSGHAFLGAKLEVGTAVEVAFAVDTFKGQFDQAGVLVREGERDWVKAGVEQSDGRLQLSAVVTRADVSDWSVALWPSEWDRKDVVVIRVSRAKDSLTFRVRLARDDVGGPSERFLRLCPASTTAELRVGPYACAPKRKGFFAEFHSFVLRDGDASLHPPDETETEAAPGSGGGA